MPLLNHPLMNRWKINRLKTSHPTVSLGSLLLLRLKILHRTFHLVTQLGYDPFLHIYLSIIVTLPLLHCTSLTPIMRPPLTLYDSLQLKRSLMHYLKTILGIWWLSLLGNLWLVISGSTRSKLALIGQLSDIKLFLLQKVLHRWMELIMKRPLLWLLESHLFVPS